MAKIKCNCSTENKAAKYQEDKYGKGVRIGTPAFKVPGNPQKYTCTVCLAKTEKEAV